jgi:hypothetical protein
MNMKIHMIFGKIGFVIKTDNRNPLASVGGFFDFVIDTLCINNDKFGVDFAKKTCNNRLYDTYCI